MKLIKIFVIIYNTEEYNHNNLSTIRTISSILCSFRRSYILFCSLILFNRHSLSYFKSILIYNFSTDSYTII